MKAATHKPELKFKGEDVVQVLDLLHSFFSHAAQSAKFSQQLHEIGASTELAEFVKKVIDQDPLDLVADNYNRNLEMIKQTIDVIVQKLFSTHKENIKKAYRVQSEGGLSVYDVILKDRSLESRAPFFDFQDDYEKTELGKQFPLIIRFTREANQDKIQMIKEIELSH
ncbi:hypothetical protein [Solitalea lacus]|uniref:hypothetical protein n=1 Tax=Solitalea lacus TaxID=2911172 RepID=UPI001EDAB78E|nr:hypothetical protein [Solitalea lacus]UKJ06318.1 hypothetical protein L2B55_12305 [Solitalea lacus]